MPLSSAPGPLPPPDQAWTAVHAFVARCRTWAVDEIARRRQNGKSTGEWESYLRFTDHTLAELDNGTLDPWFGLPPTPDPVDPG